MGDEIQLWRKEDTRATLERIDEAMGLRRMNRSELARLLGIRQATVTQWFTLGRLPDTHVFLSLPKLLGGDGNWWMGLTDAVAPDRVPLPPAREKTTQAKRVAAAVKAARKGTRKKRVGRKGE